MTISRRQFIARAPGALGAGLGVLAVPSCYGGDPASNDAAGLAPNAISNESVVATGTSARASSGFVPAGYRLSFGDDFDDADVSRLR